MFTYMIFFFSPACEFFQLLLHMSTVRCHSHNTAANTWVHWVWEHTMYI